jgi:uncharacterized membrane protein
MPTPLPPQLSAHDKEWENPANWKVGLFYYAPNDPRPWVPKKSTLGRRRFGVTPNLANRGARIYMAIAFGFFVLLLLLLSALEKLGVLH